jgi:hypothetical protein
MLTERQLRTIKMSLVVAIDSHKDTIKQRNRIIENSYRMDDENTKLYRNANKITEGWIEDAENSLIAVNDILNDGIYD